MGPLSPFHMAVELGGPGWEHEESDASLLAGALEPSLELRSTVHLDSGDREQHAFQEPVQEARRRGRRGSGVDLKDVPSGDGLEDHAGERKDVQGVELDQVSGDSGLILLGFAYRRGSWPLPLTGGDPVPGRLSESASGFQPGEDAPDHGGGNGPALLAEQADERILAPPRTFLPQPLHCFGQGRAPCRLPAGDRPSGSPPPGSAAAEDGSGASSGRRSGG